MEKKGGVSFWTYTAFPPVPESNILIIDTLTSTMSLLGYVDLADTSDLKGNLRLLFKDEIVVIPSELFVLAAYSISPHIYLQGFRKQCLTSHELCTSLFGRIVEQHRLDFHIVLFEQIRSIPHTSTPENIQLYR